MLRKKPVATGTDLWVDSKECVDNEAVVTLLEEPEGGNDFAKVRTAYGGEGFIRRSYLTEVTRRKSTRLSTATPAAANDDDGSVVDKKKAAVAKKRKAGAGKGAAKKKKKKK